MIVWALVAAIWAAGPTGHMHTQGGLDLPPAVAVIHTFQSPEMCERARATYTRLANADSRVEVANVKCVPFGNPLTQKGA